MRSMRLSRVVCVAGLAVVALFAVTRVGMTHAAALRRAGSASTAAARPHASGIPAIHHVWTIVLENESAATTFPASNPPAPYLATTLTSEGAFLPNYYGIGHSSLDNYIAMISGQAPNSSTQGDCIADYDDVTPATISSTYEQAEGTGCVYPTTVQTVADQLNTAGLTWKEYAQSMPAPCTHPALDAADSELGETPGDPYATRHNPFVYFDSITGGTDTGDNSYCDSHDVDLTGLATDLESVATTPNYSFITPDVCGDGHDATCNADPSRPGGFAGINGFLSTVVPEIMASPAYQKDGLIMIVFDEAATSDSSACCDEQPGGSGVAPGGTGPGGGRTGAVLLSRFIAPGTVSETDYNHYSMLRSVEDIFGLPYLGYAGQTGVTSFASDVFTNPSGNTPATTTPTTPTTTPPKTCTTGKKPHASHGRLPANSVIETIRLHRSHGRESLIFTGVYPGRLTVTFSPVRGHGRHKSIIHSVAACHAYSLALPSGHWKLTIRARVGKAAQRATARY
jgi:phosphatidylinositol-3-phosphatase